MREVIFNNGREMKKKYIKPFAMVSPLGSVHSFMGSRISGQPDHGDSRRYNGGFCGNEDDAENPSGFLTSQDAYDTNSDGGFWD